MAYARAGSTAGANPPMMGVQPVAFGAGSTFGSTQGSTAIGGRVWFYVSTHLQTDVGTSDFLGDGTNIGVKIHDVVFAISLSSAVSFHRVTAVGSTFTSCSAGQVISSAS